MLKIKDILDIHDDLYALLSYVENEITQCGEEKADVEKEISLFFKVIFDDCKQVLKISDDEMFPFYYFKYPIMLDTPYSTLVIYRLHWCVGFSPLFYYSSGDRIKHSIYELSKSQIAVVMRRLYLEFFDKNIKNRYCPHCGEPLEFSEVVGYSYYCSNCDEDFYMTECEPE